MTKLNSFNAQIRVIYLHLIMGGSGGNPNKRKSFLQWIAEINDCKEGFAYSDSPRKIACGKSSGLSTRYLAMRANVSMSREVKQLFTFIKFLCQTQILAAGLSIAGRMVVGKAVYAEKTFGILEGGAETFSFQIILKVRSSFVLKAND